MDNESKDKVSTPVFTIAYIAIVFYRITFSLFVMIPISFVVLFIANRYVLKGILTNNFFITLICAVLSLVVTIIEIKTNFLDRISDSLDPDNGILGYLVIIVLIAVAAILVWKSFGLKIKGNIHDPAHPPGQFGDQL